MNILLRSCHLVLIIAAMQLTLTVDAINPVFAQTSPDTDEEIGSFDDALNMLILDDLGPLRNEVREVLVEEFGGRHSTYFEILAALARGKCTKKEIGDSTHVEATSLSPYLYDLMELMQIVQLRTPVTEDPARTKKGRYVLTDNFFRFAL